MSDVKSPLPWRIEEEDSELGFVVWASNGQLLFTGDDFTLEQARLIVTAVNHHDELVEALGACADHMAVDDPCAICDPLIAQARTLLARTAKERGE